MREFGTNNLPDCSNMCHEATGRAMTAAIGSGKGTVDISDWREADAIILIGDNAASNAPRMLTLLAEAERRGAQLVHINPLIEAASRRTIVPHEVVDMATFHATKIGTMNVQVRIGGDLALLRGTATGSRGRQIAGTHVCSWGSRDCGCDEKLLLASNGPRRNAE